MKKIISLAMLVLFFTACQKDDVKKEETFDTTPKENSLEDEIQEVSVLIHEGHLHGASFHNNPSQIIFKKKFLVYFKRQENGKWRQVLKGNPDEIDFSKGKGIPAEGGNSIDDFRKNQGARYSFEITFYGRNGEELNSKIVEEEDYYQVFFTTDSYHNLYNDKEAFFTENNGKDLINLRYRDTNPINQRSGRLRPKPIGFKSYMGATKFGISYNINISLFEWNSSDRKGNGLEFYNLPKGGGITIASISIPMDVIYYRTRSRADKKKGYEIYAKYFGVTPKEYEESINYAPDKESGNYWM